MAVSEIHTARSTVNRLIAYIMKDKTEIVESEKEINNQYQHKVEQNGSLVDAGLPAGTLGENNATYSVAVPVSNDTYKIKIDAKKTLTFWKL